jgi:hypothetical protein
MAFKIDSQVLAATTQMETAATLKGILKVLTDIHCKDMDTVSRAEYLASVEKELTDMRDRLKEMSKPTS